MLLDRFRPELEGLLLIESVGTYIVESDGTGTIDLVNQFSSGESNTVTFDFVIQEWEYRRRSSPVATKIFAIQRQPGLTVEVITSTMSRNRPPVRGR